MKDLIMGQFVNSVKAYPRKCSARFNKAGDWDSIEPWLLKPQQEPFSGYVVGKRHVIMSQFKPHHGTGYGEDYEQGWVEGKREWVWLVSKSEKHEPLLVRDEDILP